MAPKDRAVNRVRRFSALDCPRSERGAARQSDRQAVQLSRHAVACASTGGAVTRVMDLTCHTGPVDSGPDQPHLVHHFDSLRHLASGVVRVPHLL